MTVNQNIALLVDAENGVSAPQLDALLTELNQTGSVIEKRAIGNWSNNNFNKKVQWDNLGFKIVNQTGQIPGHNGSDFRLVIEAIEMVHDPDLHIDTFVVMSSDQGFIPLYSRLRQLGKNVIVAGNRHLKNSKIKATTDRIINLNTLVQPQQQTKKPKTATKTAKKTRTRSRSRWTNRKHRKSPKSVLRPMSSGQRQHTRRLIQRALAHVQSSNRNRSLDSLYRAMKHCDTEFSVRRLGYARFFDFLRSFPEIVTVVGTDKTDSTVYPGRDTARLPRKSSKRRKK